MIEEIILAIICTVLFAVPLIMIFSICNKTIKELNDSLEEERKLWEEYYELEVIGNIHENPELIEKEKE